MESTQENIQFVYFNNKIVNYQGRLSIDSVMINNETTATITIDSIPQIVSITNWTYVLDVSVFNSNDVQITNATSPLAQVYINFINTETYNGKQFLIENSNITIDGVGTAPFDLTNENHPEYAINYSGLIVINPPANSSNNNINIEIKNINVIVDGDSSLDILSGWVCHGSINNSQVSFTNCNVSSSSGINLITSFLSGCICGGGNGSDIFNIYIPTDSSILTFTSCNVIAYAGNISIQNAPVQGGICGGANGFTNSNIFESALALITLTYCNVIAKQGNIIIDTVSGGMCGGYNGSDSGEDNGTSNCTISITDCNVIAEQGFISVYFASGGMCGGYNGFTNSTNSITSVTMTFTQCNVSSFQDINISILFVGQSEGGICGGLNGFNGSATLTFNECNIVSLQGNIFMPFTTYAGGICGGLNSNGDFIFNNCFIKWCKSFNSNTAYPITYFYILQEQGADSLIIIGDFNDYSQITIDHSSCIQAQCPPPPTPPQPPGCLYLCPPKILFKVNLPFNGNTVNSSITNPLRYSQLVRAVQNGRTQYLNSPVNAFGYYAGGPGGSGAPPRNAF